MLVCAGAGVYFYVMVIDAVAVHAGQMECLGGFPSMMARGGGLSGDWKPACDETPLYVVPLLDGLLCPLLVRCPREATPRSGSHSPPCSLPVQAYSAVLLRSRRLDIFAGQQVLAAVASARAAPGSKGGTAGAAAGTAEFTGGDPEYAARAAERAAEAEEARGRFKTQQQSGGAAQRPAFQ